MKERGKTKMIKEQKSVVVKNVLIRCKDKTTKKEGWISLENIIYSLAETYAELKGGDKKQ